MKAFLKRLTPLTGGAIAVLIGIIICGIDIIPSQGWSLLGIFYLLPLMLIMLIQYYPYGAKYAGGFVGYPYIFPTGNALA
jgi:hypothetical protein